MRHAIGTHRAARFLACALVCAVTTQLWSGSRLCAQTDAPAAKAEYARFLAEISRYRLAAASAPEAPFQLHAEPLLNWGNPERAQMKHRLGDASQMTKTYVSYHPEP